MNITFDAQPLAAGRRTGVANSEAGLVTGLIKQFPDNRYRLTYFALRHRFEKKKNLARYCGPGVKTQACSLCPAGVYRSLWGLLPLPYRLFFRGEADITHFFNFLIPPGVRGKKVVTVHDMAFRVYPETVRRRTRTILRLRLGRTLRRADRIIAPSRFTKEEILRFYRIPPEKISVVPNGADPDIFRPALPAERDKGVLEQHGLDRRRYFLYVGTLEPRKNLVTLIEAFARFLDALRKQCPELPERELPWLALAGQAGWYYDAIYKAASQTPARSEIRFIGYVRDEDLPALYRECLALVFPSLYEGFGMPVIEAMACGAPVLSANAASMPEICGDAALLCDPLSAEDMAAGMLRLYLEPDTRRDLREKGLRQASLHTWDAAAAKLYSVYQEVVRGKKDPRASISGR